MASTTGGRVYRCVRTPLSELDADRYGVDLDVECNRKFDKEEPGAATPRPKVKRNRFYFEHVPSEDVQFRALLQVLGRIVKETRYTFSPEPGRSERQERKRGATRAAEPAGNPILRQHYHHRE